MVLPDSSALHLKDEVGAWSMSSRSEYGLAARRPSRSACARRICGCSKTPTPCANGSSSRPGPNTKPLAWNAPGGRRSAPASGSPNWTLWRNNYRDQQGEGLITMAGLREKLGGLAEECASLKGRLAELRDGRWRLRELERLLGLVEAYLTSRAAGAWCAGKRDC